MAEQKEAPRVVLANTEEISGKGGTIQATGNLWPRSSLRRTDDDAAGV